MTVNDVVARVGRMRWNNEHKSLHRVADLFADVLTAIRDTPVRNDCDEMAREALRILEKK